MRGAPDAVKWGTAAMALAGLGVLLLGAYVGGGTYVRCAAAGEGRADCRVEVRRWLGRSVVDVREVAGVMGANSEMTTHEETYKDSSNRTRRRTVEAWRLVLARHDADPESIAGLKQDVIAGAASVRRLLGGDGPREADLPFSEWKFSMAAMAFGAVWTLITGLIAIHTWKG